MVHDCRFPHLFPVDGRHLPGLDSFGRRDCLRMVRSISARTGLKGFYDGRNGTVLFVYGDEPHGGPLRLPFRREGGEYHRHLDHEIDEAVSWVNLGKADRRDKNRWADRQEREEESENDRLREQFKAERRPDAARHAKYLDRARRGVQKVFG